jgi:hypothetical protein
VYVAICASSDLPALWAYDRLRAEGLPIELILAEQLINATEWVHRLTASRTSLSFRLPSGKRVRGSHIDGVLNRLTWPPAVPLLSIKTADRDYALSEMRSLFISWLHSLKCPVLNRPSSFGLSGEWRPATEWAMLAHKAGFSVPIFKQNSRETGRRNSLPGQPVNKSHRTAVIAGANVCGGSFPRRIRDCCLQLAQLCGVALLAVDLVNEPDRPPLFIRATSMPDLRIGGSPLVPCLHKLLSRG